MATLVFTVFVVLHGLSLVMAAVKTSQGAMDHIQWSLPRFHATVVVTCLLIAGDVVLYVT